MWVLLVMATLTTGESSMSEVGYFKTETACTVSGEAVAEYLYDSDAQTGAVQWKCLYQPIEEGVGM